VFSSEASDLSAQNQLRAWEGGGAFIAPKRNLPVWVSKTRIYLGWGSDMSAKTY
jgi:hypothetical protein